MKRLSSRRQVLTIQNILNLVLAVVGIGIAVVLVQYRQYIFPKAAGACSGQLFVKLSNDGQAQTDILHLSTATPTRYYAHIIGGDGSTCSTKLSVATCIEDKDQNTCQIPPTGSATLPAGWRETPVWANYYSDTDGLARIDWPTANPSNTDKKYHAMYRIQNSSNPWSNMTTVYTDAAPQTVSVSYADYFIAKPGYAWEYTTTNNLTGKSGKTRIQIEAPTNVCGVRTLPWRFTKNSPDAYWNPTLPGQNVGNNNLRFFVVDPTYSYKIANFNNYVWVVGDKRYAISSGDSVNDMQDINFAKPTSGYFYGTLAKQTPTLPAYTFISKQAQGVPLLTDAPDESAYFQIVPFNNTIDLAGPTGCNFIATAESASFVQGWRSRVEKDSVTVNGTTYEALRMDSFEGNISKKDLLKESWYFAKGIGLARIEVKHFNQYGSIQPAPVNCADDPDCMNDHMSSPSIVVNLTNYWHNPTLKVSVSSTKDGAYSNAVSVTKSNGYWLQAVDISTGKPYTGYLEAKDPNGRIFKWYWVENGKAHIDQTILANLPLGTYSAQFRVWIPDDSNDSTEGKLAHQELPWSNSVSETLVAESQSASLSINALTPQPADPGTCTTSTWKTACGYKGVNWCAVGTSCSSGWVTGAKTVTACPGNAKLVNTGTLCTRADGTKQFTGKSTCVVDSACGGCTTSTWYGAYGGSGKNWCAVGTTCNTGWITAPQVSYSCPAGRRLKNTGTYCTRPDGTKHFSGTAACVL